MRRLALATLLLLGGCATLGTRRADPAAARRVEWLRTLEQARVWTDSARHVDADRLLATFAAQYAGTPEANETLYWRGVYRLDPANRTHTSGDALEILNAYLASPPADSGHAVMHAEARVLRRTALELQRLQRALSTANAATDAARASSSANVPTTPRPAESTAKDEEIARLKEELRKQTDELERIKNRLRPKP